MMIAIALSMLRPSADQGNPNAHITRAMTLRLAPLGLATGFASGFFGIGGGFLIAPGLMAASGMTLANASASSLLSVTLFGTATSSSYALAGMLNFPVLGALIVGGIAGTLLGLPLARILAQNALLARRCFATMVIVVAVYILAR